MEATRQLLSFTLDDEARLLRTRDRIRRHLDDIVDAIYRDLVIHPHTAAYFADASGAISPAHLDMQKEAFRGWLLGVLDEPLDAGYAQRIASVARAHVQRSEPAAAQIPARYFVVTMARVEELFSEILAEIDLDSAELCRYVSSWRKRLMIDLDLMLAACAAVGKSAHWY